MAAPQGVRSHVASPRRFWLHALKGPLKEHYAVSVSGNWRMTFRFEDGAAVDVDQDCH